MSDERQDGTDRFLDAPSSRLHGELDIELVEVGTSADLFDNDEPERGPYETRLRSLHGAVVAMEVDRVGMGIVEEGTVEGPPGEATVVDPG